MRGRRQQRRGSGRGRRRVGFEAIIGRRLRNDRGAPFGGGREHAGIADGVLAWPRALRASIGEQQILDLVFAIGQYTLVSMVLNSLGVQTEDGTRDFLP